MGTTGTARLVDDNLPGFTGHAALYRLDPPLEGHLYVVVSATTTPGYAETYLFAGDEQGKVTDWLELPGSYKGGLFHTVALADAGYAVD